MMNDNMMENIGFLYYYFTIKVIMIYHVNIIIFQKVYFTIKRLNRYQFIIFR